MQKIKKFSLFFAVNFIALIWTIFQNDEEFSSRELLIFFAYVVGVVGLEAIVVLTLDCVKKIPKPVAKIAAGIFTGFNVYTLILIHNPVFAKFGTGAAIAAMVLLGAAFFALFRIEKPELRKNLDRFSFIMAGLILVQFFFSTFQVDSFRPMPSHFTFPKFTKRPNVYVITFDAMSPEGAVKRNLGVDTLYSDKIKKYNGRIIPNAFTERISTKWSLNSFQAMDLDYFEILKKKNVLITNKAANPTYEMFRKNDYKIQFMYVTNFFGDDNGRLDFYGVAQLEGMCMHVDQSYGLAGYCFKPVQNAIKSFTRLEDHEYPQYLFDRIKQTAKSGQAWYTQAHIYTPGHTPNSFDSTSKKDWEKFRKRYKSRSAEAVKYLEQLLSTIKEYDPSAILIIFGDHGPITSRDMLNDSEMSHYALDFDPKDLKPGWPLTYKQIVQDRHGVYLAVFPKTFCQKEFSRNPYSVVRIMRDVGKCLSNGEDPLPADFQPNDDKWKPYSYE